MKKKLLVTLLAISMTSTMLTGCLPKPRYNPENDVTNEYEDEYDNEVQEFEEDMEDDTISDMDLEKSEDDSIEEDVDIKEDTEEVEKEESDDSKQEEDDNKKAKTTVSDQLSSNWKDLQFQLNGQVLTLPCDYSDIEALGYSFDLSDYGYENGYILNPGDSTFSTIYLENAEGAELSVGFINTGDEAKDILECQIWSITGNVAYEDVVPDLVFPGGITWGDSLEDVEAAYGPLDEEQIYTSDDGEMKAYYYEGDDGERMDVDIYINDADGDLNGITRLVLEYY